MATPLCTISLMLEPDFRAAILPLLQAGEVDALEWSFDVGWGLDELPPGIEPLLDFFSDNHRLLGHGVTFSPLSGQWQDRQAQWLEYLREEVARRNYSHVTEHFGFMTAGDFHQSAPLPVPRDERTIALGQKRMEMLAQAAGVPVGLENLAFAFGPRDVADQGGFLQEMLRPVDGFLLLDLHNLYCQSHNFNIPGKSLMESYPLDRVRELHVSGGSWSDSILEPDAGPIRRDTHDDAVPQDVFTLLEHALKTCPNINYVTLERLGQTITDEPSGSTAEQRDAELSEEPADTSADRFRADFRRMRAIVEAS